VKGAGLVHSISQVYWSVEAQKGEAKKLYIRAVALRDGKEIYKGYEHFLTFSPKLEIVITLSRQQDPAMLLGSFDEPPDSGSIWSTASAIEQI